MSGERRFTGSSIYLLADNPLIGPTSDRTIVTSPTAIPKPNPTFYGMSMTRTTLASGVNIDLVLPTIVRTPSRPTIYKEDGSVTPPVPTSVSGKTIYWAGNHDSDGLAAFEFNGIIEFSLKTINATAAGPISAEYSVPWASVFVDVEHEISGTPVTIRTLSNQIPIIRFSTATDLVADAPGIPINFRVPYNSATTGVYVTINVYNGSDKDIVYELACRFSITP
jgi:hypothetical protein